MKKSITTFAASFIAFFKNCDYANYETVGGISHR